VALRSLSNPFAARILGLNGAVSRFNVRQASENTPYPSVTTTKHPRPRSLPLSPAFSTLKYSEYRGPKTHDIETYSLPVVASPAGVERI
jgi:hypothetical protein